MSPALAFTQKGLQYLYQYHEAVASVLQEDMYRNSSSDQHVGMSCPVVSFSSLALAPVTSFVLALLMWPWSGPVQGPGVDRNLKKANRKTQTYFQLDQLPEWAHSISSVRRRSLISNRMSFCGLSVRHVFPSFIHLLSLL